MARRIDPAALVVRVPGLCEHAIACQIDDARREVGRGARRRLTELESAYAAGESIIVAVSALRDAAFPEAADVPWIADRWSGVTEVRITAEDCVQPAVRHRNGRSPAGH
jgi:hypothetical protein